MDRLACWWFRAQAELALHKHKATAFQDHFNDVMEAAHGSDFIRVRPAGKVSDRKCDGYLRSTDTVFQVYAPTCCASTPPSTTPIPCPASIPVRANPNARPRTAAA